MRERLLEIGRFFADSAKMTAIVTLDTLGDEAALGVLVGGLRSAVAKTRQHLQKHRQQRILRLFAQAAQQVHDELGE